ncbi:MAG: hypothetical protein R2795_22890 [Saprospiraceae bacterium]
MEPTRLFDFIYYQAMNHPLDHAIGGKNAEGKWQYYSTERLLKKPTQ